MEPSFEQQKEDASEKAIKHLSKRKQFFFSLFIIITASALYYLGVFKAVKEPSMQEEIPATQQPSANLFNNQSLATELPQIQVASRDVLMLNDRLPTQGTPERKVHIEKMRVKLAERKELLTQLLKKDPLAVWRSLYPPSVIAGLPMELKGEVEQPVKITAKIDVIHHDDFENKTAWYGYSLRSETGERTPLYIAGDSPAFLSDTTVNVSGFDLWGNILAYTSAVTVQSND